MIGTSTSVIVTYIQYVMEIQEKNSGGKLLLDT